MARMKGLSFFRAALIARRFSTATRMLSTVPGRRVVKVCTNSIMAFPTSDSRAEGSGGGGGSAAGTSFSASFISISSSLSSIFAAMLSTAFSAALPAHVPTCSIK